MGLSSIYKSTGTNQGGISKVWFARTEDILSIPSAINGIVSSAIVMQDGKRFMDITFTEETGIFREPLQVDELSGGTFIKELTVFVPKERIEVLSNILSMKGGKFVLLYKDSNGIYKIIGDKVSFMLMEVVIESGARSADRNGTTFRFKGTGRAKSSIYTGPSKGVIASTSTIFSNGFSKGFLRTR